MRKTSITAVTFLAWLGAALFVSTASAAEPARRMLHGHVPAAVRRAPVAGRVPAGQTLRLCIGLPLRNPEALDALLRDLYDPASPRFRRFLTPDQFDAAFGPTAEDRAAAAAFVRAYGLVVAVDQPDRRLLDVAGAAADVERAFHVTLREYRHPAEARTFFAPDTEPSVDAGVPVADIWGLSDYPKPRPLHTNVARPSGRTAAPNAGTGPSGSYRGYDFRNAYAPDATNLTGAGQTVGLFQADGFYASDITTYESQAGLPAVTLQTVLLDGFSGTPHSVDGDSEVSLDIEMAISMAPGLSRVIVYEGNPTSFYPTHILSRIVSDNLAKQVSSSWSWSGGPSATIDTYLQQMAAQGQSYFQASGDDDAYLYGAMDNSLATTTPVDSPYVTCVGGTTLSTGSGAAWQSETVWNWGGGVGSSGGISSYYAIPPWQQGVSMASNQGSTAHRNIPDVALTADNVYVCYNKGSSSPYFGGTSCAAPLWAGFCALVNQLATAGNLPPVGFLNPALYTIGKGPGYATAFHDTIAGDNTSTTSPTNFYAVAGYDLCTGWGTPNGMGLIMALLPLQLSLVSARLSDADNGNGNGIPDPGETIQETLAWTNNGFLTASNITATLTTAVAGITFLQASSAYPDIPALTVATNLTPFRYRLSKSLPAGTVLTFTNLLSTGGLVFTGVFSRIVGEPPVIIRSAVTNASGLAIRTNSTIYVTNLVSSAGTSVIGRVTACVRLNFSRDSSLVIALQHPDGTEVLLSNGRGGTGQNFGTGSPSGAMVFTVFDAQATTPISSGTAPFAGTYRPDGALSNLVGKGVNGAWRLRLTDSSRSSTGTFYSWGLSIGLAPTQYTALVFDHPPVASNQSVAAISGATTSLVLRASDPDGDPLTFRIASLPPHGSLSGLDTNSGAIAYTSARGYSGTDAFTFVANDAWADSASATVSVIVTASPLATRGTRIFYR